jgi:hypothetical protein
MATNQVFQTVSFTSLIYNIDDHIEATREMFFKRFVVLVEITNLLHGVESTLTGCKLYSYSKTSQNFIEPNGHKSPPLVPVLSQINPVNTTPHNTVSPTSILILSIHVRLSLPSDLFPSGFATNNLHAFLFFPFVLHALLSSSSLTWSF